MNNDTILYIILLISIIIMIINITIIIKVYIALQSRHSFNNNKINTNNRKSIYINNNINIKFSLISILKKFIHIHTS